MRKSGFKYQITSVEVCTFWVQSRYYYSYWFKWCSDENAIWAIYTVKWLNYCDRSSIDTNSEAGKNEADALLCELLQRIESTCSDLKAQELYDLEKSLDFQCAKDDFQVWINNILITNCLNESFK